MTQLGPPDPTQAAYERGFRDGARFGRDPWPDVLADPGSRAVLDAGLADVAAGRVKPFKPWRHITNRPEGATQAARTFIGGRYTMHQARAFLAGVTVTALVTVAALLAVPVRAHDITSAVADCTKQTITITGTDFDVATNSPVTLTGPGGYLQTFQVTTPDWTQSLPLGPNGSYTADWPHSDGHAFTFQVACTAPTAPPTPTPTRGAVPPEPTPVVTPSPSPVPSPSPTPTASVAAATSTPKPTPEPTETPIPSIPLPQTDTE